MKFIPVILSLLLAMHTNGQPSRFRHLYIFGEKDNPQMVLKQLTMLDSNKNDVLERDVKVTVVTEAGLISKYHIKDRAFTIILVGKDGGEKYRSQKLLQPKDLFSIIDAMPMRKAEMRKND